jgi:hypothetical protein
MVCGENKYQNRTVQGVHRATPSIAFPPADVLKMTGLEWVEVTKHRIWTTGFFPS